jgi:hypothetical protein
MGQRIETERTPLEAFLDARGFHISRDQCGNWIIGKPARGELITVSISEMVWIMEMIELLDKPLAGPSAVRTDTCEAED